jgi:hypothetical protein
MRFFRLPMPHCTCFASAIALSLWLGAALAASGVNGTAVVSPQSASATAPASGAPGSLSVGSASITYVARAGDTLISIALQYTDKSSNWIALGKLNRIDKDSAIPIGSAILIPGELLGDTPAKATVVAMTGAIAATTADGTSTRLSLGASVAEGTRIDTGANSFLTLALADQSRISLPSNSQVRMTRLRTARYLNSPRTEVMLLRGGVESLVTPLQANRGRYEVRTPLSVAGVRGTHFRVGFVGEGKSARIATETLDGKVAVATAGNAGAVDALVLTAGKGDIIDGHKVGPAIDLLRAPRLLPAAGSGRTEFAPTRIALLAVPGARAYHLQIATDPEALNLIAETRGATPVLGLDGVADGDYYVRLSAIDRFGLEGFAGIESISLRSGSPAVIAGGAAASLAAPTPPAVAASDGRTVTLRWTPTAQQPMRLQLSRDSDFTYLLGSRVGATGEARLPRPPFGTYYARVELLDAQGNVRASSLAQPIIVTDQWVINDGSPIAVRQSRANPGR